MTFQKMMLLISCCWPMLLIAGAATRRMAHARDILKSFCRLWPPRDAKSLAKGLPPLFYMAIMFDKRYRSKSIFI